MGVGLGKFFEVNEIVRQRVEEGAIKADTLEKLARKIDVPIKTFKATIDSYNQLARMGKDPDFGKCLERLTTIGKPPFFAAMIKQEFLVVLGGLNTNIRFQPLDADGNVIPGLYLAGNTVGNRFAVDYPTMCPGLTHGMAYLTGRIAGQNAAQEKR
jgi:fumarate reductase flavoprotein subunit